MVCFQIVPPRVEHVLFKSTPAAVTTGAAAGPPVLLAVSPGFLHTQQDGRQFTEFFSSVIESSWGNTCIFECMTYVKVHY
jgi:hypothetical protein